MEDLPSVFLGLYSNPMVVFFQKYICLNSSRHISIVCMFDDYMVHTLFYRDIHIYIYISITCFGYRSLFLLPFLLPTRSRCPARRSCPHLCPVPHEVPRDSATESPAGRTSNLPPLASSSSPPAPPTSCCSMPKPRRSPRSRHPLQAKAPSAPPTHLGCAPLR